MGADFLESALQPAARLRGRRAQAGRRAARCRRQRARWRSSTAACARWPATCSAAARCRRPRRMRSRSRVGAAARCRSARAGSTSTACSPKTMARRPPIRPSACSTLCSPRRGSPTRSPTTPSPTCPSRRPCRPPGATWSTSTSGIARSRTSSSPTWSRVAVGVETSSRLQTVWQVRVLGDDAGTAPPAHRPTTTCPAGATLIAPSTGVLTTGTFEVAAGGRSVRAAAHRRLSRAREPALPRGDPRCRPARRRRHVQVVARERQRRQPRRQHGLGHRAGARDARPRRRAALQHRRLGRDHRRRARVLAAAPARCASITVDEATRRITFAPALPAAMLPGAFPDSDFPRDRNLRVRRWDQKRHGASAPTPAARPVRCRISMRPARPA